jgi:hypothetical protein
MSRFDHRSARCATFCAMRLGIPWRQWGQWALFIAAVAIIVMIVLGVSTTKPWFWNWFSP